MRYRTEKQLHSNGSRLRNAKRLTQKLLRGGAALHKATRKKWYGKLTAATERAMRRAEEVRERIGAGEGATTNPLDRLELQEWAKEIGHYLPLAAQCVAQARKRVLEEQDVPHAEKIFSIFEPHTKLLIRGKAGKKMEFGHMVEVRQIEGGLITHYAAHLKRPAEAPLLERAVAEHKELFGRVPEVCAGDNGFYAQQAVENVVKLGVKRVCVPKKGRRNEEEETKEHSRWFKMAQAFRAGIEGTISVLKRVFGLWPAFAKAGCTFRVGSARACWPTTWFCWRGRDAQVVSRLRQKKRNARDALCLCCPNRETHRALRYWTSSALFHWRVGAHNSADSETGST